MCKKNEEKGYMKGKFSPKGKINVKWARNIKSKRVHEEKLLPYCGKEKIQGWGVGFCFWRDTTVHIGP